MSDESKKEESAREENPAELSDEQVEGASAGYTYYKVTFGDLVLSSFQTGGSSHGEQVEKLTEKVELDERDVDDLGIKRP